MVNIVSFFSGIGGLELGLEWSGVGKTVQQIEIDAFCNKVLAKHWPSCNRTINDITKCKSEDIVSNDIWCGGFPCQDLSVAGKGEGLNGKKSGLWYDWYKLIEACKPKIVIVENVSYGKNRWLPTVRRQMQLLGYNSSAYELSSFDVGAPHRRKRVFCIFSNPNSSTIPQQRRGSKRKIRKDSLQFEYDGKQRLVTAWEWYKRDKGWTIESPVCGVANGVSNRVDRNRSLGNAVNPYCSYVIGRILYETTLGSPATRDK